MSKKLLARSVGASCSACAATLETSELRRKIAVPRPATISPTASRVTVTPVTLPRRLMPRHHRVTASVFFRRFSCRRAIPSDQGPRQAVLPALSM
jgi:hypothetical protein